MKKIAVIGGGIALIGLVAATMFLQKGTNLQGYLKAALPPGVTCTFTGLSADPENWNVANNWSCRKIPTIGDAVIIPDSKKVTLDAPPETAPPGEAFSLNVGVGAEIKIKNGILTISEATTNKGQIIASPTSTIFFGINYPDSVTTVSGEAVLKYEPSCLPTTPPGFPCFGPLVLSSYTGPAVIAGGGNIVFYNNFVNEGGILDASKNGNIAFQRDWIHLKNPYILGGIDDTVTFFGAYDQEIKFSPCTTISSAASVTDCIKPTGSRRSYISNFIVEKENKSLQEESQINLNIGLPPPTKQYTDLENYDRLSIYKKMIIKSGKLNVFKSTLILGSGVSNPPSGASDLPFTVYEWQNLGGTFNGGDGSVVLLNGLSAKVDNENGFNHILLNGGSAGFLPISMLINGNVTTKTLEIKIGDLNINSNTLIITGDGIGTNRPLGRSKFCEGPIYCEISSGLTGNIIFTGSAATDIEPFKFGSTTFSGTGPYSFANSLHPKITYSSLVKGTFTVDNGATVNIPDGHNLQVDGPINNSGLINVGTGSKFIHAASYAKFRTATWDFVPEYTAPADIYIEVKDLNRNLDGSIADTIGVSIIAKDRFGVVKDNETISVTLTETGLNTGIFRGSIKYVNAVATDENGILEVDVFGDAELTYTDEYDPTDIKKDTVALNLP